MFHDDVIHSRKKEMYSKWKKAFKQKFIHKKLPATHNSFPQKQWSIVIRNCDTFFKFLKSPIKFFNFFWEITGFFKLLEDNFNYN